jgi:hypothetical protein
MPARAGGYVVEIVWFMFVAGNSGDGDFYAVEDWREYGNRLGINK